MSLELAVVALLLLTGGLARAQQTSLPALPPPVPVWQPPAPAPKRLTFHKDAVVPAAATTTSALRQAQYVPTPRTPFGPGSDQADYLMQLIPATFERLIRLQSEASLDEQIRQEAREKVPPERAIFPEEKPVTGTRFTDHVFVPQVALAEPPYVNYKRLYFQDLNTERYGWELGFAQVFLSPAIFFGDLALVPYRFASRPFDCVESSAGYCLPGDPVPYLIYPPHLSVTGALGETAAILAVIATFP
jgi:hypothetical protein